MIKQVEFKLESYGISKFLYYHAGSKMDIDGGQVELLRTSRIAGILPCAAILEGDNCFLRYDMISDHTLEMLNSTPATKEQLYNSFLNIAETLADAQEIGLDLENFVFSQRDIFIDNFSNRLVFIYLPVKNNIFEKVSLREFLRELMLAAPFDETDDALFFIKLHNFLVEKEDVTPENLLEKLNELAGEETITRKPYKVPMKHEAAAAAESELESSELEIPAINPNFYSPGSEVHSVKTSVDNGVLTSEYTSQKKDVKTGRKLEIEEEVNYKRITRAELGENHALLKEASKLGGGTSINIQPALAQQEPEHEGTTVLGVVPDADEDEGTTTLGHSTRKPFLMAVAKSEKITIAKDFFKIGRDPMRADFASENKVIGRVHAHVISTNGEYFFEDNHSTNGSFVNGVKVSPKERVKIKHEDRIKLANEEYIFRLY
ncbi:FHA domain-containing protein [Mesobacillus subterraneus]|uniref:FHA domain-containing protein n=1 Tax=Mesobacillus subterraneus TaxID=285983 RepID=A0A3R9E9U6_9BACI|nr:FHA domain-containing protein [Mesobacillus subterraneus]RSD27090.1 FHA domain-containing protein [Mesobacillus subterraneus]